MKQTKECQHVPIVFCSVVPRDEVRARLKGLATQNDVVLEKPFGPELSERIHAIIRGGTP